MDAMSDTSSLVVTSQQTRFFLALEEHAAKELDIKTLNITIAPGKIQNAQARKEKSKAKAKPDTVEILVDAELRLRAGVHYALVGRNGTGKSTILHALAKKLIPGVPLKMRIAILQQTEGEQAITAASKPERTVLQHVVEGDPYRNEVVRKLETLTKSFDSGDPLAPVQAWRALRHEELLFELTEAQRMAKLRSGARGKEAREFLVSFEKKVEDYKAIVEQSDQDITAEAVEEDTTAAADLLSNLQSEIETMPVADVEAKARQVLTGLGFKEAQLAAPFKSLSGGWQMRCRLASTLVQVSDILILDEPTNYLDLLGILWLQNHLESLRETAPDRILILVSHDRDVVNAVTTDTIILQEQKLIYFNGNISSYDKSIRHEILYKSRMQDAQDKQRAHMEKTIANNIKAGKKSGDDGKVKQAKSRQKKLDDRMGMEVSAKGTRFKLNRDLAGYYLTSRAAIDIPEKERAVHMSFPTAPDLRFPGSLLSMEKVAFQYSKKFPFIFEDADLIVHRGDKIGVLGLNGAGKSTLIKILVGQTKPSKGTFTTHPRVKVAYYSQHAIDNLKTLEVQPSEINPTGVPSALALLYHRAAELGEEVTEQDVRGLLGSMGLPGRTATDVPVDKLSGGQLVRLELCRLMLARPHALILDEPTTHLDLPTVKALTRALVEWDGTVVLVSHDRYLIRCVVEGEAIDERDSDEEDSDEGGAEDDKGQAAGSRRLIYELRAGKLVQIESVNTWEAKLERRLKKLSL